MPVCGYQNADGTRCKIGGSSKDVDDHERAAHGKTGPKSGSTAGGPQPKVGGHVAAYERIQEHKLAAQERARNSRRLMGPGSTGNPNRGMFVSHLPKP